MNEDAGMRAVLGLPNLAGEARAAAEISTSAAEISTSAAEITARLAAHAPEISAAEVEISAAEVEARFEGVVSSLGLPAAAEKEMRRLDAAKVRGRVGV